MVRPSKGIGTRSGGEEKVSGNMPVYRRFKAQNSTVSNSINQRPVNN